LHLPGGTDPNGLNKPASEAAKIANSIISAVDIPVIVWGCGNAEKDTESLREITALCGDKKVCLAPLGDANYRSLGATAMAFKHPMVAASPIDVNLAKQLNILLENLGVSLNTVLIDPSIGALGMVSNTPIRSWSVSAWPRLPSRMTKLQVPFICNLGVRFGRPRNAACPATRS